MPLWVVLWRRARVGRWTELAPADYNAAWQPPPPATVATEVVSVPMPRLPALAQRVWLAVGALSLAAIAVLLFARGADNPYGGLPVSRAQAASIARAVNCSAVVSR